MEAEAQGLVGGPNPHYKPPIIECQLLPSHASVSVRIAEVDTRTQTHDFT